MMTKIEVTKVYWVGIDANQKDDLLKAVLVSLKNDETPESQTDLSSAQWESLDSLRQALLNV